MESNSQSPQAPYPVQFSVDYPERDLNRVTTGFRVIVAWFAILVTGRYPRGLFDFVLGVMRWGNRVAAYAFVLVTDEYPPFRLSP